MYLYVHVHGIDRDMSVPCSDTYVPVCPILSRSESRWVGFLNLKFLAAWKRTSWNRPDEVALLRVPAAWLADSHQSLPVRHWQAISKPDSYYVILCQVTEYDRIWHKMSHYVTLCHIMSPIKRIIFLIIFPIFFPLTNFFLTMSLLFQLFFLFFFIMSAWGVIWNWIFGHIPGIFHISDH